ncbi:hypothetical protein SAMN05660209_04453 [Geodermatophilus africanus]|uniref:Uncharacterized protein n=1 Tax=Geodermatophilus africanus TaxID=1137993 RepID=A0A1H3PSG0_9ACTN|nr:hypothetical protein SAMN05660209_04453 [Geodermatophilus africanus]
MPDTAGTGDTPVVVGVRSGTSPDRADVARAGRESGTGGATLTGAPGEPATPWRAGRER